MSAEETVVPDGFRLEASEDVWSGAWKGPNHWICTIVGALGLLLCGTLFAIFALGSQEAIGAQIIFGLGAILAFYVLLVGLLNRTEVVVNQGELVVKHGPLPCPFPILFQLQRRVHLTRDEIKQLRVTSETRPTRQRETGCTYGIDVVLQNGRRQKLLTRLGREQVAFLEQELETALDVEKASTWKQDDIPNNGCQDSCCRDL